MMNDVLTNQLPIVSAMLHDMRDMASDNEQVYDLLQIAMDMVNKAEKIINNTAYYSVQYYDSFDTGFGKSIELLITRAITSNELPLYANHNLVSIAKISKKEYDEVNNNDN